MASQSTVHGSSDDEYALSGDLQVEDLKQVASLYDCRSEASPHELQPEPVTTVQHVIPPGNIISAPPVISLVDDDDDFGDDIDADEFAAAEIAATQAPATTVRRSS